jgi:ABC-type sugar transport system substrate-binding protein
VLRKTAFALMVLTLLLGMSSAAFAQKTTVLRVVVVKTDSVAAYLQGLEQGKEVMKKIGLTQQLRVWQATFRRPECGKHRRGD